MSAPTRRRFYRTAAAVADDPGHRVTLDDRPVRTPGGRPLLLPTAGLAEAVAAEWQAQGDAIVPDSMPLMQLTCTALDRVAPVRAEIVERVAAYGETDLLCHRADRPPALVERQAALWQPPLDWAAAALGIRLTATEGILAVAQPPEGLARLRGVLGGLDGFILAAVAQTTGALGSVVLALALACGRLAPAAALQAAFLDEDFQAERWGRDAEAAARRTAIDRQVAAADRLVALCGRPSPPP